MDTCIQDYWNFLPYHLDPNSAQLCITQARGTHVGSNWYGCLEEKWVGQSSTNDIHCCVQVEPFTTSDGNREYCSSVLERDFRQVDRKISKFLYSIDCYYSAVILDAPIGQSSDVWALVEPLIAKKTKVSVLYKIM